MNDQSYEQIIVSDFDNDFWYEIFDLKVMQIRAKIVEFNEIKISIRTKEAKGHITHLHAKYADKEVSVSISDGEILDGNLPQKKIKLLKEWILSNEVLLKEKWNEYHKDGVASFTLALDSQYETLMPKKQKNNS